MARNRPAKGPACGLEYDSRMPLIERLTNDVAVDAPVALVLPGAGYTTQAPLLYWPILSLANAGWQVWSINWHADINESVRADLPRFVEDALARADEAMSSAPGVVIGKSLGTYALPYFVDRDVRAAWLTPILTVPTIADAARAASNQHLLVGGTADPSWDTDAIRGTQARIVSMAAGNHGLEKQDAGWRESAANQLEVLQEVITHITVAR